MLSGFGAFKSTVHLKPISGITIYDCTGSIDQFGNNLYTDLKNHIMANETHTEHFINHWLQYRGVVGMLKYARPFILTSLLLSPIILTGVNPNIWSQIRESTFERWFAPMLFLVCFFALLPAVCIALITWRNKNQRFMRLTTAQNRYLPFEKRAWLAQEKPWHLSLSILCALTALSLLASFGLLLGHNAPAYFTYPFKATLLFWALWLLYSIFMSWKAGYSDGALFIPAIFKVTFMLSIVVVLGAWLYVWCGS